MAIAKKTRRKPAGKTATRSKSPARRAATATDAPAEPASTVRAEDPAPPPRAAEPAKPPGRPAPTRGKKQKQSDGDGDEPGRSTSLGLEVDAEVLDFIAAIDQFKKANNRQFPSWSEVLFVLKELGYRKR